MIGAISGDMIGAPYEFDRGRKTKEFPLFGNGSHFTDDSVILTSLSHFTLTLLWGKQSEAFLRKKRVNFPCLI